MPHEQAQLHFSEGSTGQRCFARKFQSLEAFVGWDLGQSNACQLRNIQKIQLPPSMRKARRVGGHPVVALLTSCQNEKVISRNRSISEIVDQFPSTLRLVASTIHRWARPRCVQMSCSVAL